MKKIQMVDLISQYQDIKGEVDASVTSIMGKAQFINGPDVKAFGEEMEAYLDVKHVIPCANGTDALQIALMALGLQPGDEVICPSFTFVATAEVIALLKLTPVLVDVYPDTFALDIDSVRNSITSKTKAIVPVHLYGQCADMESLMTLANQHNLHVVEDTAQAIGASYTFSDGSTKKAGTMGTIGCTSFFPSKNLGCFGDGGAIFTNDDALAKQMRMIVNHGMSKRYYHDAIGVNSRLDTIQAAILRIKLRRLDCYNSRRNRAAAYYDNAFAGNSKLQTPYRDPKSTHVFHQYTMKVCGFDRFELQEFLSTKDIPAMVYYPVALHMQSAYKDERYPEGHFPTTEELCECVISLPMHSELSDEQLKYITDAVLAFIG